MKKIINNMKIEEQCVSLELAKRLKLLNVKQESLFYWYNGLKQVVMFNAGDDEKSVKDIERTVNLYSAFTTAELGKMLEKAGSNKFIKAYGEVFNFKGTTWVGILGIMNLMKDPEMGAKMLIYLLENNL